MKTYQALAANLRTRYPGGDIYVCVYVSTGADTLLVFPALEVLLYMDMRHEEGA